MIRYQNVADLHTHTDASDGAQGPAELCRLAGEANLEIVAITDHDSISAFDKAFEAGGLEVIRGLELSAEFEGREAHILGYYLDTENEGLRGTLYRLQQSRRERLEEILSKLSESDIDIEPQLILGASEGCAVGRLHVAEILIERGHSGSIYEAFRDFLGPAGKAFVPKTHLSVKEAVGLLHGAGGCAVLAHPGSFFEIESVLSFRDSGLDGIEAYYPSHSELETLRWLDVAKRAELLVTGGSDFHGRTISDTPIGAVRVSRAKVEAVLERSMRYAAGRLS